MLSGSRSWLLALLAILLATAMFGAKGPLQDIHWDAPIYLQRARAFAETPYVRDFALKAREIEARLRAFKADSGQDAAGYGQFIRLGHIVVLGSVVAALGPDERAIQAAFWIYILILVAAVVLTAHTAVSLMKLFHVQAPPSAVVAGAAISSGLYLASDVSRHLAGNFVAEIPALFLLALSLATLVAGLRSSSVALGAASGAAAFLMYVCKADAIWVYLSFLLVLGIALFAGVADRSRWKVVIAAALTSAVGYVAYAIVFWPLPDPRLILVFMRAHGELSNSVHPLKLWTVAGGMLWFGVALAAFLALRERLTQLGFAWLLAVFLPYVPATLAQQPLQARVLALSMPAFLVLSSVGWTSLLGAVRERRVGTAPRWAIGAALLFAIALSHQETYAFMRQIPGGWRLQYVRAWLSPPNYERLSYPLADLQALSEYLYADPMPKVLILDKPKNAEVFSLVEFLRSPGADGLRSRASVVNAKLCGAEHDFSRQRVTSCLSRPSPEEVAALAGEVRLLYLQRIDEPDSPDDPAARETLFQSGPLVLRAWRTDEDSGPVERR